MIVCPLQVQALQSSLEQEQQKRKNLASELVAVQAEVHSLRGARDQRERELAEARQALTVANQEVIALKAKQALQAVQVPYIGIILPHQWFPLLRLLVVINAYSTL